MLDESFRAAILVLHGHNHSIRAIARAVKVSRDTVKRVLAAGASTIPENQRLEKAEAHREEILELFPACKGNLIRVHEILRERGAELSYQALTGFCRRHGIGHERPQPAGEFHFEPGEEMQHDTSPHRVRIGERTLLIQDASLVLCHSRMLFHQYYPTFNRFWCKVFLTEALQFFGGACARCMIDNTHVVVSQGTGASMIPAPEMAAFAERFGFGFHAHALGQGHISVGGNRYSVPYALIGRRLEVRETRDQIEIYDGPRQVAAHRKLLEPLGQRVINPDHRAPRGQGRNRRTTSPEETELLLTEPALAGYITAFRSRHPGRVLHMLRKLQVMVRDYPRAPLLAAIRTAQAYGLFDLERLDRMVLRHIGRDYFVLETTADPKEEGHEG